jgi:WD40 repeat protein
MVVAGSLKLLELEKLSRFSSHDGNQPSSIHVALSDRKQFLSSHNGIRLWNAQSGAHITSPLKGHFCTVYSVAFSPDGKKIISGSLDKTFHLWDA